ncbi:hypothetical protein [Paenibacillus ginsengarvi]|uniref:Uncharacterized protein n=1 Tax=Paenibacillus ginsengarvi TaxID=400777 RepID=A0A3B0CFX3_9BACL|nr:hypothetical protein [Paenibacillus ginsengarvi]RKN84130.1 hypothetical protein D7M11_14055 [Paenibacillus ginsengarvi]
MNWLQEFEEELTDIFAEAERTIAAFPEPLAEKGRVYLHAFHPLRKESTKNYICYLLPYWVNEVSRRSDSACRQMALANIYVMLFYFIQDDLMDTPAPGWKEQLGLAAMMQEEFLEQYRQSFDSASPFWAYYKQYSREWAASVAGERISDDWLANPLKVAHKASPVKLASTGFLLLSGQEEAVTAVSAMIDEVLVTLQMADDYADWMEDLKDGNANCLLALIGRERARGGSLSLTVSDVKKALYVEGCLGCYARLAADRHERLRESGLHIPKLVAFHAYMTEGLAAAASAIDRDKQMLLSGGFYYIMSKIDK